jgi:hypothetical protein
MELTLEVLRKDENPLKTSSARMERLGIVNERIIGYLGLKYR